MRKETTVVIEDEGRDKGKIFRIREMSASQAEAWASRLFLALARSGAQVPEGFLQLGMAGFATIGLSALGGLSWEVAQPLLDEMMGCVRIQPSERQPNVVRDLIEDDIEEIKTRLILRDEVVKLHTGFSIAGFLSNSIGDREVEENTLENPGPYIETFGQR